MQRPPQQVWSKATSHKSLHGRPHSDNNGGTRSQVDPSGVGETHVMTRMSFKPAKSRSLVLRRGRLQTDSASGWENTRSHQLLRDQWRALGRPSTADWMTETPLRQPVLTWRDGWEQWISLGSLEDSRPGSTSMESSQESSGLCLSMRSPWLWWKVLSKRWAAIYADG